MISNTTRRLAPAILAVSFAATSASPALAAQARQGRVPVDPLLFFLQVGQGCPDFNLGLAATGGSAQVKTFTDSKGEPVRVITAATGVFLTYTNFGTNPKKRVAGESVTIKTSGSVNSTVTNPDGTQTVTATGHNGLILFPTDVPAGPTATQYSGRIVYNVDPETGVFTLLSTSGPARDICAELAG